MLAQTAIDRPVNCADKATIERLYGTMVRAVTSKAASIVRRPDVAAEIAHDTFIKLWQGGGSFPNEKAVYCWLYKTCHRAAIDHLRSAAHRREQYGDDDATLDYADPAAPRFRDAPMTRATIQRYVEALNPQESEAFLYVVLDGMTQEEVADVMKLSRRTVQRLLARAETKFEELRRVDA